MTNSRNPTTQELLQFAHDLVDACLHEAGTIRFDKGHPQQLYAICTYGSLVEISSGILALADADQITSVPILLRTLLDAFASFHCCVKDPNHFKAMYASFTKEKLRFIRTVAENPGNPYVVAIAAAMDAGKEQAALEKTLGEINAQGYSALKPWEEFEKAGLRSEYQTLYWQLCMHAHNNVSTLEDRHLIKKNGDYEVVFFKEESPNDIERYLDSMCGILVDASLTLHKLYPSDSVNAFSGLGEKLNAIRGSYT